MLEFLSERGDSVDVLTYAEGADVEIPNCRVHRIPRIPGLRNIRAGFSFKKVICDALMVAACLGMMRRTRYDLIHAVEESAFIASADAGVVWRPLRLRHGLLARGADGRGLSRRCGFAFPALRRMEALAIRRSIGVLTVCAALEDVALAHDPEKLVGRVEDTTLLPTASRTAAVARPLPGGTAARSPCTWAISSRIRGSISCSRGSATR